MDRSIATPKNHEFIAAIRRKGDDRFEFYLSPAYTKVFDSTAALNDYLKALGLEKLGIAP